MYYRKRFLTVTGRGPSRDVIDASNFLQDLEIQWWPEKFSSTETHREKNREKPYIKTPRRKAELLEMLSYISADCSYERYRGVIWAILWTGWPEAENLSRYWCLTAPHRYDEADFLSLVKSFNENHNNPITVGTLKFWAKEAGWDG